MLRVVKSPSIRVIAAGTRAVNVVGVSRETARETRPTAVSGGGVEAWPPWLRAVSRTVATPFSPTPTIAARPRTNGSGASVTAPPSSSTSHGVSPRSRNTTTIACAAAPKVSSLPPNER